MKVKDRVVTVGNSEYKVKFVDGIDPGTEDGFLFGQNRGANRTIYIATKDDEGNPFPKEHLERTLCHELVHAIFNEGMYLASTQDEPLVEWTARCMVEIIKQDILK